MKTSGGKGTRRGPSRLIKNKTMGANIVDKSQDCDLRRSKLVTADESITPSDPRQVMQGKVRQINQLPYVP